MQSSVSRTGCIKTNSTNSNKAIIIVCCMLLSNQNFEPSPDRTAFALQAHAAPSGLALSPGSSPQGEEPGDEAPSGYSLQ